MSLSMKTRSRQFFWILFFLSAARLLAMVYIPLNDSTEARYAEIARIMLETSNWITPMHTYNVPFWAKPPLSMWMSALSMKVFGVSGFAARIPSLFFSAGVLLMVWHLAKRRSGTLFAMTATLILAGMLYFYLDAGAVMTDPAMLFSITLIIFGFWQVVMEGKRAWGYVMFLGMGLGLLAKGPVALILAGMPIGLWVILDKRWREIWQGLPWISGLMLTALIAGPWYYLAEKATPGFLYYFIVGEHISRFLKPGWTGNLYGMSHVAPYGMIGVYALIGTLPWCLPGGWYLVRHRKALWSFAKNKASSNNQQSWLRFLWLCTLTPLVFFTLARNIIYPYVFPSLPAFALLCAEGIKALGMKERDLRYVFLFSGSSAFVFIIATALFVYYPQLVAKSQDRVVAICKDHAMGPESRLIYWTPETNYSAQFYSAGHASATLSGETLCQRLSNPYKNYVITDSELPIPIPQSLMSQLNPIGQVKVLAKIYRIYLAEQIKC